MIPMWLKIKVPSRNGRSFTLWFPLILLWFLLALLFILCLPIWLIASLALRKSGYGPIGFVAVGLFFNTLWNLQGLLIDVKDKDSNIYLKFL